MYRGFVVEDNAQATGTLVEALAERAGVTTIGTAPGEAVAIAWLANPANDWDIAIVGLGSDGCGYGVLSELASRQPHQRVVVLTAVADAAARARCCGLGCDRVFDRATEVVGLFDYCMAQAEAVALRRPAGAGDFSRLHAMSRSAAHPGIGFRRAAPAG